MKTRQKENALNEFIDMIEQSWTYDRMTESEKIRCLDAFHDIRADHAIRGDYKTRFDICHAIYSAFLAGIGYDGPSWREKESAEPIPTF